MSAYDFHHKSTTTFLATKNTFKNVANVQAAVQDYMLDKISQSAFNSLLATIGDILSTIFRIPGGAMLFGFLDGINKSQADELDNYVGQAWNNMKDIQGEWNGNKGMFYNRNIVQIRDA